MACHFPWPYFLKANGGRPQFIRRNVDRFQNRKDGRVIYLPCGHCSACRRERRQDYTCLQTLESLMWDDSFFVTLTYDDEHLPPDKSLKKEHLSSFFESLRHYCKSKNLPCRYFAVGEYGDKYERPHYHFSLFGLSLKDLGLREDDSKDVRKKCLLDRARLTSIREGVFDENGNRYWYSPVIACRWPYGHHQIYRANRTTFQYVAGYTAKKLYGPQKLAFLRTGRLLPFSLQSRPSIGYSWWKKYHSRLSIHFKQKDGQEVLVNDSIDAPGISWRIPRICMRWLQREEPDRFELVHTIRLANMPGIDREENLRKHLYDEHRALRSKQNNTHKEIT